MEVRHVIEGLYIHLELIHFVAHQKPTEHGKTATPNNKMQTIEINFLTQGSRFWLWSVPRESITSPALLTDWTLGHVLASEPQFLICKMRIILTPSALVVSGPQDGGERSAHHAWPARVPHSRSLSSWLLPWLTAPVSISNDEVYFPGSPYLEVMPGKLFEGWDPLYFLRGTWDGPLSLASPGKVLMMYRCCSKLVTCSLLLL